MARQRRSFVRWIETAHPLDVNRSLESLVFVAGSGRSGTTWLGQLLNAENRFRFIFEPFNPHLGADGAELLPRYVRPEERDTQLRDEFLRYLHGRAGNAWTGQYNLRMLSSRRLIKDIHSNLRLGWFRRCFEPFPIVLVVRHPFAVAVSQLRIGLAFELPYYLADSKLIADHLAPFENALREARSEFAQRVFQWCVETYVPLRQLRESQSVTIVLYERLVSDPQAVLEPIFRQLGLTMTPALLARVLLPAATTWRHGEDELRTPSEAATAWQRQVDPRDVEEGIEALQLFGLHRLYGQGVEPLMDDPFAVVD